MVSRIVPDSVRLTSFSILFARYKGDLRTAVLGAAALRQLKDGDTVLISEGCTHHRQCGDIGTEKLPRWVRQYTGRDIRFVFTSGGEFPENLSPYALIIHCGACMLGEREIAVASASRSGNSVSLSPTTALPSRRFTAFSTVHCAVFRASRRVERNSSSKKVFCLLFARFYSIMLSIQVYRIGSEVRMNLLELPFFSGFAQERGSQSRLITHRPFPHGALILRAGSRHAKWVVVSGCVHIESSQKMER